MKKLIVVFLITTAISGISCKKLDKLTQFNMNYEAQVTLPSNTGLNLPLDLLTPDITTNYEETFEANDTRKDLVDQIKISGITINVVSPQGYKLDFLKSIQVFISADGLAEKEVASKYNIPDGLTSLDLDYVSDNLKEYLTKNTIKLRVKTVSDKSNSQNVDLNVKTKFWVNAKVLGA